LKWEFNYLFHVIKLDSPTPEHPIFVDNKWTEAEQIKKGDSLFLFDGKKQIINSIKVKDTIATVYNFMVEVFILISFRNVVFLFIMVVVKLLLEKL
jgi:hypothetical protein